jgi:transcriptional regulator with XRE-family HTH domain
MEAVGGYLRGRRLALGLSAAEVAVAMKQRLGRNVNPSTIWKIENAQMTTGSDLLFAFLDVVHGSGAIALDLMRRRVSVLEGERIGREEASMTSEAFIAKLQQLPAAERADWEARMERRLREFD